MDLFSGSLEDSRVFFSPVYFSPPPPISKTLVLKHNNPPPHPPYPLPPLPSPPTQYPLLFFPQQIRTISTHPPLTETQPTPPAGDLKKKSGRRERGVVISRDEAGWVCYAMLWCSGWVPECEAKIIHTRIKNSSWQNSHRVRKCQSLPSPSFLPPLPPPGYFFPQTPPPTDRMLTIPAQPSPHVLPIVSCLQIRDTNEEHRG